MTTALLVLAAIMATVVGWLFKQTVNVQPWLAQSSVEDVQRGASSQTSMAISLWVFLAVVTSMFALFISAYFMRMHLADWRSLPEPALLWLNTGVLILTSGVMQWTLAAANRGQLKNARSHVKNGLIASGALTFVFLAGQLVVWQQLNDLGYFLATNPANAFFYLLTGLHGLHLLGGLVAWGKTTSKAWHGIEVSKIRLSVALCTAYWHYLLLVWLVLFALLLST